MRGFASVVTAAAFVVFMTATASCYKWEASRSRARKTAAAKAPQTNSVDQGFVRGSDAEETLFYASSDGLAVPFIGPDGQPTPPKPQKVDVRLKIYNASARIRVKALSAARAEIARAATDAGGYVLRESTNSIVVRVPVARFEEVFRKKVLTVGVVEHYEMNCEDVTEKYLDLARRLRAKRAVLARFEELLKKAGDVDEAARIMERIADLTEEIEALEGKIKRMAHLVAFSTISVTLVPHAERLRGEVAVRLPFRWLRDLGVEALLSTAMTNEED